MSQKVQDLEQTLASARSSYGGRFAGQPRATRPLDRLDELITSVRTVAIQAESGGHATLLAEARRLEQSWAQEREAIVQAQAGGQHAVQASELAQWLRDNFQRYRRNFAGQPRHTRDLAMLAEIIEQVELRVGQIDTLLLRYADESLARSRDQAVTNLNTYRTELANIREARASLDPGERASLLAELANVQFQRYRDQFAGKSRISRHRRLLDHIVAALDEIYEQMIVVRDGSSVGTNHERNIEIVAKNLTSYKAEVDNLRIARGRATRSDRVRGLAVAANEVFDAYRAEFTGKPRASRDPDHVSALWEQLWPVALEMSDLAADDNAAPVAGNLQKVRDTLRLYELEWERIREAKGS